ncbi:flagellar brake protein [Thauera sp.]|jgi:c-di-GMP-binding flagellar brake protein YcgR|uniref:flagellar brake protein n=1 Tax=Thauera sp. TaxID=1905334 RepID=UPI002A36924E|nr:flagellar brake protein [Thauera sp.]MDX9886565.1 flagellar brake protein [Thauera sp.]
MTDTTNTLPRNGNASAEATTERKGFSFADMQLTVGDRLQVECPAGTGMGRAFVRVIGYVDQRSILVTAPLAGKRRIDLVENDVVVVRVFSRENAFAFRASVLRACRLPFHYVHLSFPEIIQGSVIRKATRVRTERPVSVDVEQRGADATPGTILNISASGLLLRTRAAIGDRDSPVRLRFELPLHGVDTRLALDASLRNVVEDPDEDGIGYQYGVDFHELQPSDHMVVKAFVYQTIIEHPRLVI